MSIYTVDPVPNTVRPHDAKFLPPAEGQHLLAGRLIEAKESLLLDRAISKPGTLYYVVRKDLTLFSPIPVSRLALTYSESSTSWVGVIDSNGRPYYFSLGSKGLMLTASHDDEQAWSVFEAYIEREQALTLAQQRNSANDVTDLLSKALPRADKEEEVKKQPTHGVSVKKQGENGKIRYTYNHEQAKGAANAGAKPAPAKKEGKPDEAAEVEPDDADPEALAKQLGVPLPTLRKVVLRFVSRKALGGRNGFITFAKTHLRSVSDKHRLDDAYWGMVFDKLSGSAPQPDQS